MGATIEGKRYRYDVHLHFGVEGEDLTAQEALDAVRYAQFNTGVAEPLVSVGDKTGIKVTTHNIGIRRNTYSDDTVIAAEPYPPF